MITLCTALLLCACSIYDTMQRKGCQALQLTASSIVDILRCLCYNNVTLILKELTLLMRK